MFMDEDLTRSAKKLHRTGTKLFIAVGCWVVFCLGMFGTVIYVAGHFISKFW